MTLVEDVFQTYESELADDESSGQSAAAPLSPAAPATPLVATLVAQRKQMHGLEESAVRHVCDRSPLAMWAYEEESKRIVYANETAVANYGYSSDEMRSMTVFDLLSPEENLRLALHFATYPTVEGIAGYWRYQTSGGEQRWFELFCQKIGLAGHPAQLVTAIDVTAKVASFEMQTLMQVDLQESQRTAQGNAATLKMILEEMSDAFAAFDSDWHFAAMNRRAEVLLRNDRSFLIGKSIWQEYPQAVGTVFYDKCQEVLREGKQINFEYYSEPAQLWLEVSAFPLSADLSEALLMPPQEPVSVYGVSIFFRDVTARKEAEAEKDRLVRERNAEVSLQRHFLKEVLFSATEGKLRLCDAADDFPQPPQEPERPALQISSASELASVRQQVRDAVLTCGFTLERGYDLTAAASEAAMNALQHSNAADRPAHASVYFALDGREIQVWVTDYGKGMQLRDLPRATLMRGHSTRGTLGHGFHLILQLVDEIYLMTGAGGTTVVLRQFLQPPAFDWLPPDEIGK